MAKFLVGPDFYPRLRVLSSEMRMTKIGNRFL
jgi:hypothetical protein